MSEHAARLVHAELVKKPGVDAQLIDVRDLDIASDDAGEAAKLEEFSTAVDKADGLIIVSPEYNHGYPGMLKRVLDTNYSEYVHKAVGVVSVSNGPFGGVRMIENLIPVLRAYGLVPIVSDVNFSNVDEVFDEEGSLLEARYLRRVERFLGELLWMAETLRYGREQIRNKVKAQ